MQTSKSPPLWIPNAFIYPAEIYSPSGVYWDHFKKLWYRALAYVELTGKKKKRTKTY